MDIGKVVKTDMFGMIKVTAQGNVVKMATGTGTGAAGVGIGMASLYLVPHVYHVSPVAGGNELGILLVRRAAGWPPIKAPLLSAESLLLV